MRERDTHNRKGKIKDYTTKYTVVDSDRKKNKNNSTVSEKN